MEMNSCGMDASMPLDRGGEISVMYLYLLVRLVSIINGIRRKRETYTTRVLKNNPCPNPLIALPTSNMPNATLLHSNAAPMAKMNAPKQVPRIRPKELERCPQKREDNAAGIKIVLTIRPCTVEERGPKVERKAGIVVMGPMVPVSSLLGGEVSIGSLRRKRRVSIWEGKGG